MNGWQQRPNHCLSGITAGVRASARWQEMFFQKNLHFLCQFINYPYLCSRLQSRTIVPHRASVIARHFGLGIFLCPYYIRIGGCHSVIITVPCGEVVIVSSGMCSRLSVSPRPAVSGYAYNYAKCRHRQSGAVPRQPQTSRHGSR